MAEFLRLVLKTSCGRRNLAGLAKVTDVRKFTITYLICLVTVPVIGVFTKYDKLTTRLERTMDPSRREGLSAEEFSKLAEEDAEGVLKKICFDPFEESVGKNVVPYIHVSSMSNPAARYYTAYLTFLQPNVDMKQR
jgi:hypothetical protein